MVFFCPAENGFIFLFGHRSLIKFLQDFQGYFIQLHRYHPPSIIL
nr:MAG TPA: hypothetical protein [Caudoviricetes sp.]